MKIALITAGGSGMGAACARPLAADGFAVAILSSSGTGEPPAAGLGGFGVTGSNQSPDDLTGPVKGAGHIAGQNLHVDGGLTGFL